MKAVVINAPGDYEVKKVPVPACPDDGLLLKIMACGLCGSDLRTLRSGHHRVKLPWIVGHEIAGKILETGPRYTGPWEKDGLLAIAPLVYCGKCEFCLNGEYELCSDYKEIGQKYQGGFAEYMPVPGEAIRLGTIRKIPDGLDPVHATLVEPLSSCVNAQEKGNIGLGDTVLIIGAGPIGTLHLELARARGANKIIVADISSERLCLMEQFAPDHIINSSNSDIIEEINRITRGYGADVIITANPDPQTLVDAVKMARKGGRILLFGGLPREKSCPGVDMNIVHYNALHLIGTTIFAPRHNRTALELIASEKISAKKLISHVMPLSEFQRGAKLALEGKARKIVFVNENQHS